MNQPVIFVFGSAQPLINLFKNLVSRELLRILENFHFSISISKHFDFTFHFSKKSESIFFSLCTSRKEWKLFIFTSRTSKTHSRWSLFHINLNLIGIGTNLDLCLRLSGTNLCSRNFNLLTLTFVDNYLNSKLLLSSTAYFVLWIKKKSEDGESFDFYRFSTYQDVKRMRGKNLKSQLMGGADGEGCLLCPPEYFNQF